MKKIAKARSFKTNLGAKVVNVEDLDFRSNASNLEHTVEDLHDILKSYYKVARKRFVDEMCMQAADHFLVTGPQAPIKLFSPRFVNSLSSEELQRIAGEDSGTKAMRERLQHDIDVLENGKRILM